MKKVMIFGVFDGIHPGHVFFINEAKKYGEVIAVVARDKSALDLKNHLPAYNEEERMEELKKLSISAQIVLGDENQGSYEIIKKYNPDIICLGYDQSALKEDLENKIARGLLSKVRLVQIAPHYPEKLHSSLLRGKMD